MHHELNSDTKIRARELARQVTVAHDLDPEIQEELYGHIEDKMLAYKSGEEPVSDEDAFILVREHLGDAKVIRGLLQEVHAGAVQVDLGRKLMAIVIATLGVRVAGNLLQVMLLLALGFSGHAPAPNLPVSLRYGVEVGVLCLLFYILHRWKRVEYAGAWYRQWTFGRMWVIICIVAAVGWLIPIVTVGGSTPEHPSWFAIFPFSIMMSYIHLWLWWTAEAPKGTYQRIGMPTLLLGFMFFKEFYPARLRIVLGPAAASDPGLSNFVQYPLGDTVIGGHVEYLARNMLTPGSLYVYMLLMLVYAMSAYAWQRWRPAPHQE